MNKAASPFSSRAAHDAGEGTLVIGLVNNMPDTALLTTERQFGGLITAAAERPVELKFYALPDVPRSPAARAHIDTHYDKIDALWEQRLDGLVVTGTAPRSRNLVEEPYWASLTKLIDWAQDNTRSAIWSCLAAHAAVLHLDGIERQPLGEKLSGLFDCAKTRQHPIMTGVPAHRPVPHSRYNNLPKDALLARQYILLSQSQDADVDMFLKQGNSLFVFFQGHPEYDPGALLREYRADVSRFLNGERESFPNMPRNYFDAELASEFMGFRQRAEANRTAELFAAFPFDKANARLLHSWHRPAVRIYRNWLAYLAQAEAVHNACEQAFDARERQKELRGHDGEIETAIRLNPA